MRHWVFDLDGTLIDSAKYYDISIEKILNEEHLSPTAKDIELAYKYFNPEDFFKHYFEDPLKIKSAVQRMIELNHEHANEIEAFPRIHELIKFLYSKKVKLSVWTGRDTESAKAILKNCGLFQYLDFCVGRTCVERNKPYPDGLLKILEDSQHQGNEVVMVGDHEYDMLGAKAAGVKAISVAWHGIDHHSASKKSDLHFTEIKDLISWAQNHYN